MPPPLPELDAAIAQLGDADPLVRNEGADAAIALGRSAVPALRELLDRAPETAPLVVYALARIADSDTADVFLRELGSEDEQVSAQAAVGLARIGHPDALRASLQTLNDDPDVLHHDMTPAVRTLGDIGLPAARPLLDRMIGDDPMTRLRASRALERIVTASGGDWGGYEHDAPPERRAEEVERWRRWLAERGA